MADKEGTVADALDLLGEAWRGDWSDFDGRILRHQLTELADFARSGSHFDLESWAYMLNICPVSKSWTEHCLEKADDGNWRTCRHIHDYYEKREIQTNG